MEDVFYKIKVRTGMVHLTADAIAELYIGQNDSMTLLRNNCSTAMLKADELKDKIDEKKDTLKRLQNASKETNQHKSFYQELDVVEKELHDRVHLNEMAMEKAKKAKLNVSYITNVLKKLRYVSNNIQTYVLIILFTFDLPKNNIQRKCILISCALVLSLSSPQS